MIEKTVACLHLLFDPGKKLHVRQFLAAMEEWLRSFDIEPDLVSIGAPGFSREPVSFTRVRKKLGHETLEEATFVELVKMPHGSQDMGEASYDIGLSQTTDDSVIAAATSDRTMSDNAWLEVTQRMLSIGSIQYAYAYILPKDAGPRHYAAGVTFCFADRDPRERNRHEEELRERWSHVLLDPDRYPRDRTLRQIYRLQILSDGHLCLKISDGTLRQWIKGSASRGEIRSFAPGLWVWSIPDKQKVYEANLALFGAGLLTAWDPTLAGSVE